MYHFELAAIRLINYTFVMLAYRVAMIHIQNKITPVMITKNDYLNDTYYLHRKNV